MRAELMMDIDGHLVDKSFRTDFQQVLEFQHTYGQPIGSDPDPTNQDETRTNLRNGFIIEEFLELMEAQGYSQEAIIRLQVAWDLAAHEGPQLEKANIVEIADALCDLKYFICGSEIEYGIDGDATFHEVHASNMSKLGEDGKPIYREDGKIMKGPNYFKPRLAKVLVEQQNLS